MNACPIEDTEQELVIRWSIGAAEAWPELAALFAIPNGGFRTKRTAALLKRTGTKAGVPDLCLPVPRGGFCGLYIEMKRRAGGVVAPAQREWHTRLRMYGHMVEVCRGHEEAIAVLRDYLAADGQNEQEMAA